MSWASAALGDLCEIEIGKTPSRSEPSYWRNGTLPWLSIADMSQGRQLSSTKECITEAGAQAANMRPVMPGTLLLSYKLSIGKVGIAQVPLYTNEAIAALSNLNRDVDPNFMYWALQHVDLLRGADRAAMGATLNKAKLKEIRFPVPPLVEQRRIAAILDKADALRVKRREAIAKLYQLLQSVFLDMFGDPVTNPKGWTLRALGEVCDVRDGTHDSPKYVDSGYPLVTSKNLSSGRVILDGAALISEIDYQQINKRSKVHRGDLLMPMIGTVGNPVLVDHEPNYAVKNVAIMKFGDNEAMGVYVLHLLRSHYFNWVTSQKNRGGTQKFLALGDIRGMRIPVPSNVCFDRFEQIARVIRDQRVQHDSAVSEASRLFSSIQTEIFSGKMAIRNV